MFLVLINIPTFRFSPSKIFLQLLVPIKFSIITFGPYFSVNFCIFLMKLSRNLWNIVKKSLEKKIEFFNKT